MPPTPIPARPPSLGHPLLKEKIAIMEEADWVKDDSLRSGRSSLGSPGRQKR